MLYVATRYRQARTLARMSLVCLGILGLTSTSYAADPPFTYRIRVKVGEAGRQGILNNLCKDSGGNPYVEPYADTPSWRVPPSKPPSITLTHSPDQLITYSVESQYFSTSELTPPGEYRIYWVSTNSVHCNGWYWNQVVDVVPTISADASSIWWFGGERPNGYKTELALTSKGGDGPFSWSIEKGADLVEFENGQATYQSGIGSATLRSKATPSDSNYQVEISVTVNGEKSDLLKLTARRPWKLINQNISHRADPTWGYMTTIWYTLIDNIGSRLPDVIVPYHEEFTGRLIADYPGKTWRASVPNGSANYPTLITDTIGGEHLSGGFIPNPLPPQTPLGKVRVDHQKGRLVIGSSNSSGGLPVADLIWQKFQDHAIHRNVVTPVN